MREEVLQNIFYQIRQNPYDIGAYADMMNAISVFKRTDEAKAHEYNGEFRGYLAKRLKDKIGGSELFELYKKSLLFDTRVSFDAYMLYLEINREPSERFYQPRRKALKPIVDALQELATGELDELFVSQPPRTGKTTLLLFFLTWILGRDSERTNLYSAYSATITDALYEGVLEIIRDPDTYLWHDVFPEATIAHTDGADTLIHINRRKRYASLTCRSIDGTLNGACDCDGFVISDDLISGIEEALNKDRLKKKWDTVNNNLLSRAKMGAKRLWIGTRWSLADPIGMRLNLLQNDVAFASVRYKVINVPALDENDESNFDYDYSRGFDTEYFKRIRATFERSGDIASWEAQYQGMPIERSGALFEPQDFNYYNGELPDIEPDRVVCGVDPAFGGGDYVAAPILYQYGNLYYLHDVLYSNEDKSRTVPVLAQKTVKNNINMIHFEETRATATYREAFEKEIERLAFRLNVQHKSAPSQTSKDQRIFDMAPDIKARVYVKESGKRDKMYEIFIQNVFSFKAFEKNRHDDAPDSLAITLKAADRGIMQGVKILNGLF